MKPRSKSPRRGPKRRPIVHIKIEDGRFEIQGLNAWQAYWREPYHLLLTLPWITFFGLLVLSYVSGNAVFALLYLAGGDCIANAHPGSFLDAFFFSVQTAASIGYGAMYPKTLYANTLVTIESMVSLGGVPVLTGLAFARFTRPSARVVFSRVAVITTYEGIPSLMFRTANKRRNQILEATLQVYLLRDEVSAEGQAMRRFYTLPLLRSQTPSFSLSWSVIHPIDENSPLYGATPESLKQMQASIVVALSGLDETVAQVLHARHTYAAQDILWNHRLVDIFHDTPEGHRYIDYNDFHDAVPIDEA